MRHQTWFITGTGTGAGKTVLASLFTRHCLATGRTVAALKPICSGNRSDARNLRAAANALLSLDEINPWHFRSPIAPLLAARREKRTVTLAEVLAHARRIQQRFPALIIEGAGGLLSPLGEGFDSRDLIAALRAIPIVACPNRLGAVNEVRLVLEALPEGLARKAQIVLVSPKRPDAASRGNPQLLGEVIGSGRIHNLPWLPFPESGARALADPRVCRVLEALILGSTRALACSDRRPRRSE